MAVKGSLSNINEKICTIATKINCITKSPLHFQKKVVNYMVQQDVNDNMICGYTRYLIEVIKKKSYQILQPRIRLNYQFPLYLIALFLIIYILYRLYTLSQVSFYPAIYSRTPLSIALISHFPF